MLITEMRHDFLSMHNSHEQGSSTDLDPGPSAGILVASWNIRAGSLDIRLYNLDRGQNLEWLKSCPDREVIKIRICMWNHSLFYYHVKQQNLRKFFIS